MGVWRIQWSDFDHETRTQVSPDQIQVEIYDKPLPDGDLIWLTEAEGADPATMEIVLKLGGSVTWWKEVKALDASGGLLGNVARDGRHPNALGFVVSDADRIAALVFSKAKFLGWKRPIYKVADAIAQKKGRKLTFSWDKD